MPSATVRPPSGPERHATHSARTRRTVGRSLERADPLLDVGGPLHPGDREREHRRHLGTQTETRKAVLAQQRDVRLVVLGQLELPEPDRVEARCGIGLDVLGERGADGRDLGEREDHARPGSRASRRCGIGGFVSSFATR